MANADTIGWNSRLNPPKGNWKIGNTISVLVGIHYPPRDWDIAMYIQKIHNELNHYCNLSMLLISEIVKFHDILNWSTYDKHYLMILH